MSRRSHVIVDDEEDVAVAASDREGTFVNEDDDDDDKARLLAALGPDAPPEHAVGAYEAQKDVEVGPGVDADESDLVDDIFDTTEEAKRNANSANVFCRCNLASSILLIASMSLLVYTMVNPATRDAVTKFALSSQTERHHFNNVKRDPKTGRPTVELMEGEDEAEEEKVRPGEWWRLESLKGSESPSKTTNQWDLSGLMMYSDDDCTTELEAQSFEIASESAVHQWEKRGTTGWGYMADKEVSFIHEPLIGGSRVSVHLRETPRCLKIGTCFTQAKAHRRALLQSSDEAEALAAAQEESRACSDTHFPSTIALFHYGKQTEKWDRLLQYEGTGASDGEVRNGGKTFKTRTFKFKNAAFTPEGKAMYDDGGN